MTNIKDGSMLTIDKIVAPTDFSDASKHGIQKAQKIAVHFAAKLYPIHIVSPVPVIPGASAPTGFHLRSVIEALQDTARDSLKALIAEEIEPGLVCEPQVFTGDPGTEIARFADGIEADIIVIATHGQSGWVRFVSGSVTEKVIRRASVSVLAVPIGHESAAENG
jgi:nucleotide-binding universal stress UspA family protein